MAPGCLYDPADGKDRELTSFELYVRVRGNDMRVGGADTLDEAIEKAEAYVTQHQNAQVVVQAIYDNSMDDTEYVSECSFDEKPVWETFSKDFAAWQR